jgi:hypothetical protein
MPRPPAPSPPTRYSYGRPTRPRRCLSSSGFVCPHEYLKLAS